MSPDWAATPQTIPFATLGNPQTLNLYAFVTNNPIANIDLSGHECFEAYGVRHSWRSRTLMDAFRADLYSSSIGRLNEPVTDFWEQFDTRTGLSGDLMSQVSRTLGDQPGPYEDEDEIGLNFLSENFLGKGRGGRRKGERSRAATPDGTPDRMKHATWDPVRKIWIVRDPDTGKKIPKPPGWAPPPSNQSMQDAAANAAKDAALGTALGTGAALVVDEILNILN